MKIYSYTETTESKPEKLRPHRDLSPNGECSLVSSVNIKSIKTSCLRYQNVLAEL